MTREERIQHIKSRASGIGAGLKENHSEIPWVPAAGIGNRIRHADHVIDSML